MRKFLSQYQNPTELRYNYDLINRYTDGSIVPYILNVCRSLNEFEYITFLEDEWEYIEDESQIDVSEYIRQRRKSASKKASTIRLLNMNDTRAAQLILRFKIEFRNEVKIVEKKLQVPIPDEFGYFLIKGKKYILYWQLIDSSTYVHHQDLVLKSFAGVTLKRTPMTIEDSHGYPHTAPVYSLSSSKTINALAYYLPKMGIIGTLRYFGVDRYIRFSNTFDPNDKEHVYFTISTSLYIKINAKVFETEPYVRSICFMLKECTSNRLTLDMFNDYDYWVSRLGARTNNSSANHKPVGERSIKYFENLLDEGTKSILRLHHANRANAYAAVRWLIQNCNELRKKDPYSLEHKRLRCNEYLASLLLKEFKNKTNRVLKTSDKKLTIEKLEEIFKWNGDIIITGLQDSGLLRYDDNVNDMDFFSKLRVTTKGPNAIGNSNSNTIKKERRGIHPSFIGIMDINVCGNSDPGTTMVLCPAAKTHGLHFTDSNEPEEFRYELAKKVEKDFNTLEEFATIDVANMSLDEYYDAIEKIEGITDKLSIYKNQKSEE